MDTAGSIVRIILHCEERADEQSKATIEGLVIN